MDGTPRRAWQDLEHVDARSNAGTVEVDGLKYGWQLQREPRWSDDEGWKGMTICLVQSDRQRAALVEFPAPSAC